MVKLLCDASQSDSDMYTISISHPNRKSSACSGNESLFCKISGIYKSLVVHGLIFGETLCCSTSVTNEYSQRRFWFFTISAHSMEHVGESTIDSFPSKTCAFLTVNSEPQSGIRLPQFMHFFNSYPPFQPALRSGMQILWMCNLFRCTIILPFYCRLRNRENHFAFLKFSNCT